MTEELLTSPQPLVRIEGELADALTIDLHSLRVAERLDGLKTLELQLLAAQDGDDPEQALEPRYLDGRVLDFGKRLEVVLGPANEPRVVFDGKVSAIELELAEGAEPRVCVFAEDRLMELRWTRRVHSWKDQSDADIARAIATRHGLEAQVEVEGPTWSAVEQWNMSDLAFLRERARLLQAEVWLEDGKLCFKSRSARTGTELTLVRGNHLLHVVARADLAHQRTAVRVRGWDARRAEAIDELAAGSLIRDEIGGVGKTGPELLEQNFGKRGSVRVREVPHDASEARAIAEAELRRRARSFVRVSAVTRGAPNMVIGSRLTLERIGKPFEGPGWYVTELCHTYDRELGFRTRFDAERATLGGGTNS
ncbi:MAG: contractile injection system protein, VgrG/Pvc8 family [Enhygromyxa sp.]